MERGTWALAGRRRALRTRLRVLVGGGGVLSVEGRGASAVEGEGLGEVVVGMVCAAGAGEGDDGEREGRATEGISSVIVAMNRCSSILGEKADLNSWSLEMER